MCIGTIRLINGHKDDRHGQRVYADGSTINVCHVGSTCVTHDKYVYTDDTHDQHVPHMQFNDKRKQLQCTQELGLDVHTHVLGTHHVMGIGS